MIRTALILALLAASPAFAQETQTPEERALEARAGALEDEAAIRRLILDYGRRLDALDFESFAALFAEDGEWHGGGAPAVGPAHIAARMEASFGEGSGAVWTTDHHVAGNIMIDLAGDTASATSRWIFVSPGPDGAPKPVLAGRYNDTFVRTPEGWRFAARRLVNDMAMEGFPAVRAGWGAE